MADALRGEEEKKIVVVGAIDLPAKNGFRSYVVVVACWMIDAVVNTIVFVITTAMMMVGGVLLFIFEFLCNFVIGAVMFLLTCWVVFVILKVCLIIWGPKNI